MNDYLSASDIQLIVNVHSTQISFYTGWLIIILITVNVGGGGVRVRAREIVISHLINYDVFFFFPILVYNIEIAEIFRDTK